MGGCFENVMVCDRGGGCQKQENGTRYVLYERPPTVFTRLRKGKKSA